MKRDAMPSLEELYQHARFVPEIEPYAVLSMLAVLEAGKAIQHEVFDILQKKYQMSEGKLRVMIILHKLTEEEQMTPSELAQKASVSRATISVMLKRMERDGLICLSADRNDGRGKRICLSPAGRAQMDDMLPAHYSRISHLMRRLTTEEQEMLTSLLCKVADA